jgi:hypothetical protein
MTGALVKERGPQIFSDKNTEELAMSGPLNRIPPRTIPSMRELSLNAPKCSKGGLDKYFYKNPPAPAPSTSSDP